MERRDASATTTCCGQAVWQDALASPRASTSFEPRAVAYCTQCVTTTERCLVVSTGDELVRLRIGCLETARGFT